MKKAIIKKRFTWIVTALALFSLVILPNLVLAQTAEEILGLGYFTETGLGTRDVRQMIGRIINVIMGFLGVIAVIIILIGGFRWMTAGGNEEKLGKAKKLLISGIIGLAIVLAAYSIARFVVIGLINATT